MCNWVQQVYNTYYLSNEGISSVACMLRLKHAKK